MSGVYSNLDMQIDWFGHLHIEKQDIPMLFMSEGYFFDPQGIIRDTDLREYPVTGYWFDRWGNLWIGTWGLGAAKADVRTQELSLLPFGLFHPNVSAIQKMDDTFWIGSREPEYYQSEFLREQNGVTIWYPEDDYWHYVQAPYNTGFYSDQVNALSLSEKRVLLATDQGLTEFLPNSQRWLTYDQTNGLRNANIHDVVEDSDNICVGTSAGIDRLPKFAFGTDSMKVQRVAYNHLRNIEIYDLELQGDTLWAGTNVGAYLFDIKADSGNFFEGDFGPGTYPVIAVAGSDSMIWFGSSQGVDGYNLNQKQWVASPLRQTFEGRISYIVANDDVVFVATDRGLWKLDLFRYYWKHYSRQDGLLSSKINTLNIENDVLWIGTDQGLCRFYWNSPNRID